MSNDESKNKQFQLQFLVKISTPVIGSELYSRENLFWNQEFLVFTVQKHCLRKQDLRWVRGPNPESQIVKCNTAKIFQGIFSYPRSSAPMKRGN